MHRLIKTWVCYVNKSRSEVVFVINSKLATYSKFSKFDFEKYKIGVKFHLKSRVSFQSFAIKILHIPYCVYYK